MMPKLLQGTVVIWGRIRRAPNWYDEASAYVDGELSAPRRAAFEEALGESPQLQRYLDELQATKQGIELLPEVELPRSFTISIAQAQGTPRLVRREPATVVGRWFGGTTMVRNAAAFSVLAGAAFAAVVAVDISGDGGGTGVLAPSLSSVAETSAAEVEQETAVAALAPRAEAAQAAVERPDSQESAAQAESSEQAFAQQAEQAAVTESDTVTSDSDAQAAPTDGAQAAAPPAQAAEQASDDEAFAQDETAAQEPSSEPTEAIAAAAEAADSEDESVAEEAPTDQAVAQTGEQAADEEAASEQAPSDESEDQAAPDALINTPDEEAAPVAEQPVRESEPESDSSAAPARGEGVPESPDEAVTIERVPGPTSDPEADEAAVDEQTAPDVDLSSLSDDDGAATAPETAEFALAAAAVGPPDSAGENALIGQAEDDGILLILEIVFGVVLGVSLAAAAIALRRRTSAS